MVVTTHPSLQNQRDHHHARGLQPRALRTRFDVDAGQLRGHMTEAVRTSVEETLNGLLDAEADQICARIATRGRRIESIRAPVTTSASLRRRPGSVTLQVPKLRSLPFETGDHRAVSPARGFRRGGRWWRCILQELSVRRVEDITEALRGVPE